MAREGGLPYLFRWRPETGYFWLEMLLFVFLPVVLLNLNCVRNHPVALYRTSAIVVMGFITNRINVSITGLERATHAGYLPKWPELAVTLMLTTCAVLAFRYAVLSCPGLPWRSSPSGLPMPGWLLTHDFAESPGIRSGTRLAEATGGQRTC